MTYKTKIQTIDSCRNLISDLKSLGNKIVFTNGCFDILHLGHITYLEKAKALGEILIVGLNSDSSVKRLKGDSRPVKDSDNRAAVLAGLASVDIVILFEEDTPLQLIKAVVPDLLIKGGDYKLEDIVGADFVVENGGEVKTIDFVVGQSSSNFLN